jgi:hypothetical protein
MRKIPLCRQLFIIAGFFKKLPEHAGVSVNLASPASRVFCISAISPPFGNPRAASGSQT